MNWLKQKFCKHIWKMDKVVFLRNDREWSWMKDTWLPAKFYAHYQSCILCGKTQILESTKGE